MCVFFFSVLNKKRDGTRSGFDLELLKAVSSAVSVPVVASGGANTPAHFVEAIHAGASAVLAASIFHFGDVTGWNTDRMFCFDSPFFHLYSWHCEGTFD